MKRRKFESIPERELIDAIAKMCDELNISGSAGGYNLYRAIRDEQERAKSSPKVFRSLSNKQA